MMKKKDDGTVFGIGVDFDVNVFLSWCKTNGRQTNGESRADSSLNFSGRSGEGRSRNKIYHD